jgi:hypothetical protein
MFYPISCVRNMIAARRTDFIGKMMRGPPDRQSRNMITACCNHKQRVGQPQTMGKFSWSRTYGCCFKTSTQSTSIVSGPCEIGLMRQTTKNTGTNLSNASFILTRRYQSNQGRGGRCHHGTHHKLLTGNALQIMTQTMTKIMRTAAMQVAITVTEIERAIAMKDHTGKGSVNTLPCREEPPPRIRTTTIAVQSAPPLLNTIQNNGMRISAYKLDTACSNHSRFLVSDSEHLKPKLKSTTDNLPADIILTRMILQSLVSPHLKLLLSSSF